MRPELRTEQGAGNDFELMFLRLVMMVNRVTMVTVKRSKTLAFPQVSATELLSACDAICHVIQVQVKQPWPNVNEVHLRRKFISPDTWIAASGGR